VYPYILILHLGALPLGAYFFNALIGVLNLQRCKIPVHQVVKNELYVLPYHLSGIEKLDKFSPYMRGAPYDRNPYTHQTIHNQRKQVNTIENMPEDAYKNYLRLSRPDQTKFNQYLSKPGFADKAENVNALKDLLSSGDLETFSEMLDGFSEAENSYGFGKKKTKKSPRKKSITKITKKSHRKTKKSPRKTKKSPRKTTKK
jgi:hypothetical protein